MKMQDILADIQALEDELSAFELRYAIRSEDVYAAHIAGEEPKDDAWVMDFGEWASVYRTWLTRKAEYEGRLAQPPPSP